MDNVYIVEAHFEDYESSWWRIIGIFTEENVAKEHRTKWKNFFKVNKNVFDEPSDFVPNFYAEPDIDSSLVQSWSDSDEFYNLISNYGDIKHFTDISVRKFSLNKDIFLETSKKDGSSKMISLMQQWNRDYKLKNLTE